MLDENDSLVLWDTTISGSTKKILRRQVGAQEYRVNLLPAESDTGRFVEWKLNGGGRYGGR